MANNFKPWVDDANISGNVQSRNEFSNDAQRKSGFQANQPASAVRINTALRQANLVSAALMEFVDSVKALPSTLGLESTVTQVKNAFKNAADELESIAVGKAKLYTDARELVLDGKIDAVDLKADGIQGELNTAKSNITSLETNKVDKVSGMGLSTKDYSAADQTKVSKIITNGDGTKHLSNDGTYKTVANATNVTTNINGKAISSIFETNGTTVKNATQATRASYSSADTSKGTIETRLTNLGFKSGSVTLSSGSATVNTITRQGNYVIGRLVGTGGSSNVGTTLFTLPVNFRPKTAVVNKIYVKYGTSSGFVDGAISLSFGTDNTNGAVTVLERLTSYNILSIHEYSFIFGFEANAIA